MNVKVLATEASRKRAYYLEHREQILAKSKAAYAADPDFFKKKVQAHRAANLDHFRAYDRRRNAEPWRQLLRQIYAARRPKVDRRAYYAAYRKAHPHHTRDWVRKNPLLARLIRARWTERHPEYFRDHYAANRDRIRQGHHEWYWRNRAAVALAVSAWQRANPDRVYGYLDARRRRKYDNGGSHTRAQWIARCADFGNVCAYCGKDRPLTRDHIVPVVYGGTDDIENIAPACQSCNSRKHTGSAEELLARYVFSAL